MSEHRPGIFFSYRRTNLRVVDHLHEKFAAEFKPGTVFLDRADIDPGEPFPDRLREAVKQSIIVLVIIDPTWISVQEDRTYTRRLETPNDWVRQELEIALENKKIVIPILVEGAHELKSEQLPDKLRALASLQSIRLSSERFGADAADLIRGVREKLAKPETAGGAQSHNRYPRAALD